MNFDPQILTLGGNRTAKGGWLSTVYSQGLELSWELWSHTTIATRWCSDEVTSGAPLPPPPPLASSELGRGTRGKIHLLTQRNTIHLTPLLVKFPTNTKGWVAFGQLQMPFFLSFPKSDLKHTRHWTGLRWWLFLNESVLSFSIARTGLRLIRKRDS